RLMKKPWSISTTVRNPERLKDFLKILKKLEGQKFNRDNQIKYQILLIQEKIYTPLNIPLKYRKYYENPELSIPYEVAEEIFNKQDYEDPPMRGRQSVNPLNKLGFSIAREGAGLIKITELGNMFLTGEYDIGFIFFKSLLKLQFPNPWSKEFSEEEGFNIMPLIATMRLLYNLHKKFNGKGLNRVEFSLFVPTLINAEQIDGCIKKISEFREIEDKDGYIQRFAKEFYGIRKIPEKKINNLLDYGDNIMRYFRLTRYFKVSMDPMGYRWNIDLEPSRITEIEQLLSVYSGMALRFETLKDYLNYLSDITKPELPWEKVENLISIAVSLRDMTVDLIKQERMEISQKEKELLDTDIKKLTKPLLEEHVAELRKINLKLKERVKKSQIVGNIKKIAEVISVLKDIKNLKKYQPEQFEKLITEALKIINDEVLIKPNYPVDDNGEPINHSPGNKPDIECYYQRFKAICEVTLNVSRLQWVQEGQPVMRHLRDFETQYQEKDIFCIFIAPQVHRDTYSQFWISVKYEYGGQPQKIIPMTTEQFALLLETLLELMKKDKRFTNQELFSLYNQIIGETEKISSFSEWADRIPEVVKRWRQKVLLT
ncbi:MAG TPA: AlwI family type II restriction endonuclease, partial [Candidatus Ratteibacteria bacterium]|nr:AlwI family type II restriction endonuclease [Candidatus Ratteibacteria bacterium]